MPAVHAHCSQCPPPSCALQGYLGEVATASVACGVLGVGGNKGAVAVEFTLHRRKMAVVCSHFAAHQVRVVVEVGVRVGVRVRLVIFFGARLLIPGVLQKEGLWA